MSRSIRRARPADADQLTAIRRAAVLGLATPPLSDEQVQAWLADAPPVEPAIAAGEIAVFVVEQGGSIAGFGWVDRSSDRFEAALRGPFVHPFAAREGLGSLLLSALETRAREQEMDAVSVLAPQGARPFFESQGYDQVDTRPAAFGDAPAVAFRRSLG